MGLEVGDLVLCTVDRIVGTVVFVKIHGQKEDTEGSIVFSEVAPGRIRNIRDYVVPKKKIVCKILRISNNNIDLSFRRVTQKERKEILENENLEKGYINILKRILGEDTEKTIKEITEKENLFSFLEEAKTNSKELKKIVGEEKTKKIVEILNAQKKKISKIKKEISLTTTKPNGITLIKKILSLFKDFEIKYISAGRYLIESESSEIKSADKKIREKINEAEKEAKKLGVEFSLK
jgi:translation initiation factor 2 alpha subunit (eIF-2alpha)